MNLRLSLQANKMDEFDSGAGSSVTVPIRAGEIKKGMVVMLKGFPCKVVEITTSKTGKHGHAKANITGIDIFTSKKYMDLSPTSHNMSKPVVQLSRYLLMDQTEDGYVTLFDEEMCETREDIKLPGGVLGDGLRAALENGEEIFVTVTSAMGKDQITGKTT